MKKFFFAIFLSALFIFSASCTDKGPDTTCLYGDNIPEEELTPILDTSQKVMSLIESGEFKSVYALGSEDLKQVQTRDQFTLALSLFIKAFGEIEFPRLTEAFYMDSESEELLVWIPCEIEKGISDQWGMPANTELAVVVFKARTEMELVRVVVQLQKEKDEWKLRAVSLHPTTIKKKLNEYYWKKGLEFREQNKLNVAALYYKTAILLSEFGVNADESTTRILLSQLGQMKVEYMPEGEVQLWTTDSGATYKVYNLDPAYDNGYLLVQISYLTQTLQDQDKLVKEAWELAAFLDKKFPQYRLGFEGIRVTAAPESQAELLQAYHTRILYTELDEKAGTKEGKTKTEKDE